MNREAGTAVDPKVELSYIRAIELVFESIPGTVLQLAALIHAKEVDSVAYFALVSSVITATSMSAYMSWDWDIDKGKRKEMPYFYGYIPKKSLVRKVVIATSLFVSPHSIQQSCMLDSFFLIQYSVGQGQWKRLPLTH